MLPVLRDYVAHIRQAGRGGRAARAGGDHHRQPAPRPRRRQGLLRAGGQGDRGGPAAAHELRARRASATRWTRSRWRRSATRTYPGVGPPLVPPHRRPDGGDGGAGGRAGGRDHDGRGRRHHLRRQGQGPEGLRGSAAGGAGVRGAGRRARPSPSRSRAEVHPAAPRGARATRKTTTTRRSASDHAPEPRKVAADAPPEAAAVTATSSSQSETPMTKTSSTSASTTRAGCGHDSRTCTGTDLAEARPRSRAHGHARTATSTGHVTAHEHGRPRHEDGHDARSRRCDHGHDHGHDHDHAPPRRAERDPSAGHAARGERRRGAASSTSRASLPGETDELGRFREAGGGPRGAPGITDVHLRRDAGHAEICIHYEPDRVTLSRWSRSAEQSAPRWPSATSTRPGSCAGMDSARTATPSRRAVRRTPGVLPRTWRTRAERLRRRVRQRGGQAGRGGGAGEVARVRAGGAHRRARLLAPRARRRPGAAARDAAGGGLGRAARRSAGCGALRPRPGPGPDALFVRPLHGERASSPSAAPCRRCGSGASTSRR